MSKKDRKNDRIFTITGWIVVGLILPIFIGLILHHNENQAALNRLIITNGFIPLREKYAECQQYSTNYLNDLISNYGTAKLKQSIVTSVLNSNNPHYQDKATDEYTYITTHSNISSKIHNELTKELFCHQEVLGIISNMSLILGINKYTQSEKNKYIIKNNTINSTKTLINYYTHIKSKPLNKYFKEPMKELSSLNQSAIKSLEANQISIPLSPSAKQKALNMSQAEVTMSKHQIVMANKSQTNWENFYNSILNKFTLTFKRGEQSWV